MRVPCAEPEPRSQLTALLEGLEIDVVLETLETNVARAAKLAGVAAIAFDLSAAYFQRTRAIVHCATEKNVFDRFHIASGRRSEIAC